MKARTRIATVTVTLAILAGSLVPAVPAFAAVAPVNLGSASTYSLLTSTAMTNGGATFLSGNVGISPGTAFTGFATAQIVGSTHLNDTQSTAAQSDAVAAYNDALNRTATRTFAGDNNGKTFTPGVYFSGGAFALTGTMTLDGQGDPNAVFIFQIDAALNTAAASSVSLVNGAQASNVFFQANGAAGTGANSSFVGTILAFGAVTLGAGSTLVGRAFSRGAMTLASNTVRSPALITINGGEAASTTSSTPTISGTASHLVASTLAVAVDGHTFAATVRPDDTWSVVANGPLSSGIFTLVASITDSAGNTTSATQRLTVAAGSLTISVPSTTAQFGAVLNLVGGTTIAGKLGTITVSDSRGAASLGWVTTVSTSGFTTPGGASIAPSNVSYSAGPVTKTGLATFTAPAQSNLASAATAVAATKIGGANTATWNPSITVTIPGGTSAGLYTATITHSVL
jgi:hypothetical protein